MCHLPPAYLSHLSTCLLSTLDPNFLLLTPRGDRDPHTGLTRGRFWSNALQRASCNCALREPELHPRLLGLWKARIGEKLPGIAQKPPNHSLPLALLVLFPHSPATFPLPTPPPTLSAGNLVVREGPGPMG